MELKRITEVI